jgi:hypothetical protein
MRLGQQAATRRPRKTSHDPQDETLVLWKETLGQAETARGQEETSRDRGETSRDRGEMALFRRDPPPGRRPQPPSRIALAPGGLAGPLLRVISSRRRRPNTGCRWKGESLLLAHDEKKVFS